MPELNWPDWSALHVVLDVGIGVFVFLIVTLCINWARPLGGMIYMLAIFPVRIPGFGRHYNDVMIDFLHLSFVFKLAGFVVSASGVLIFIALCQWIVPDALAHEAVLWGILAANVHATLGIMHDVHLMKAPNFFEALPFAKRIANLNLEDLDKRSMMQVAGAHFADLSIVNLFIILVSYGTTAFCASALGLVSGGAGSEVLTPFQGISSAFSVVNVVASSGFAMEGGWAVLINGFYGLSVFIFTVFFIGVSSRLIDQRSDVFGERPQARSSSKVPEEILAYLQEEAAMAGSGQRSSLSQASEDTSIEQDQARPGAVTVSQKPSTSLS